MFMKKVNIIVLFIGIFACSYILASCSIYKKKTLIEFDNIQSVNTNINNDEFENVNLGLFKSHYIYLLKSQTQAQMESIIVKDNNNNLIIFDGGRTNDSDYLMDIIKENNSTVKYWFLTHVHDDHIGAIFDICDRYKNEIYIENICYNFLDTDYYYQYIGHDAGIVNLVNQRLFEYKEYMSENKNYTVNIFNNLNKSDSFEISSKLKVEVLNKPYALNHDVVNNSSVVYMAYIEDKKMIVLGDLAYYGGEKLIEDYNGTDVLKSDIVVMAHHGQNGVDYPVYEKISPKIALWPTTKKIYYNIGNEYKTNETKEWLEKLNVLYQFATINKSYIIK